MTDKASPEQPPNKSAPVPAPESTLDMAARHIEIGERLVSEQQALVDRLRAAGETVSVEAERLLVNLKQTLALMRQHLEHERNKKPPRK